MAISSDTWAIVAATGLGPILAVLITLWRTEISSKYNRRLYVFRTLMATRKVGISPDHVNAINLIEVDYYGCRKVEAAWSEYKDHLNDNSKPEDEPWREKKERLVKFQQRYVKSHRSLRNQLSSGRKPGFMNSQNSRWVSRSILEA